MKKIVFTLACLLSLSAAHAITSPMATLASASYVSADSVDINQYVGKYKFEGLPFDYITVSVKEGKLMINTGSDEGELTPVKDAADKYDADGKATFTFKRNADKKITGLQLEAQGFSFEGTKEA